MLPTDYAALSDVHLMQMSSFYVCLKTGLESFPDLYKEVQTAGMKPFCAIYAELVRRILEKRDKEVDKHKSALIHTLYWQSAYTPYHAYGKYGEVEWISKILFDRIERRRSAADSLHDYSTLDLILDTCCLLDECEPEDRVYMETALAQWKEERGKDNWLSLPADEVAHRILIQTIYNDLPETNVTELFPQLEYLLETFSSRILNEADASALIVYREALRNTYYFDTVSTEYFSRLEQRTESLPEKSLSRDLLQTMLLVDRTEREQTEWACSGFY